MHRAPSVKAQLFRFGILAASFLVATSSGWADESSATPAQLEYFERHVRPILVEKCQSCHGVEKQKGGLRLDSRTALLAGGDTGPAIEPGDPESSILVDAIRYGRDSYQMPPSGKLPEGTIARIAEWVAAGAAWPNEPDIAATGAAPPAFDLAERAEHWAYQPLQVADPPAVQNESWPRQTIDRFVLARLEANDLHPAAEVERDAWLRRVTFDLTGLPPTREELQHFLADDSTEAFERIVERLLASPHYGERWGRHWLDLVRYAETLGHEFDYELFNAWRYRDYVIRAFNADVPYDQFLLEHVAGDLLDQPRRNPATGENESILGTGFFWLCEGKHSPVDLRQTEAERVENQIDVFGKTFLGLTIACARCHDHKFDAITTKDYYALAGYLKSSRYQQAFLDDATRHAANASQVNGVLTRLLNSARNNSMCGPPKERLPGLFGPWATSGNGGDEIDTSLAVASECHAVAADERMIVEDARARCRPSLLPSTSCLAKTARNDPRHGWSSSLAAFETWLMEQTSCPSI